MTKNPLLEISPIVSGERFRIVYSVIGYRRCLFLNQYLNRVTIINTRHVRNEPMRFTNWTCCTFRDPVRFRTVHITWKKTTVSPRGIFTTSIYYLHRCVCARVRRNWRVAVGSAKKTQTAKREKRHDRRAAWRIANNDGFAASEDVQPKSNTRAPAINVKDDVCVRVL